MMFNNIISNIINDRRDKMNINKTNTTLPEQFQSPTEEPYLLLTLPNALYKTLQYNMPDLD
jgi:hypothetical protein